MDRTARSTTSFPVPTRLTHAPGATCQDPVILWFNPLLRTTLPATLAATRNWVAKRAVFAMVASIV